VIRARALAWAAVGAALVLTAGNLPGDDADAASGYMTACCSQTVTLSLEYNVGAFSWTTQNTPALHYHRVWNASGVLLFNSYTSLSEGWSPGGCACYRQAGIKRDGAAPVTDLIWQVP
jgi:hypothetical protein